MKSPLVVAVLVAAAVLKAEDADPSLMPAYTLSSAQASYLKALRRLSADRTRADRYDALLLDQARRRGLDARLLKAVMAAESGFDRRAVSSAGAIGLMQVMPATAAEMGVHRNLHDPEVNVAAGAAYLALLQRVAFRRHGYPGKKFSEAPRWLQRRVVAAYNYGPKALDREAWPQQTRLYSEKVLFFYKTDLVALRGAGSRSVAAAAR